MGVNIVHYKDGKIQSKEPKSQNIYRKLLVKLYSVLSRPTNSTFNQLVLKELYMSHTNQLPLSLFLMSRR